MSMGNDVLFAPSRRQAIVDLVNERGDVTVTELCERFAVSPATVRNDLRDLEEKSLLERTHGGAITCHRSTFEPTTFQKEDRFVEEKKAIAELAVQQIVDGDTIALDNGTTVLHLAKLLGRFERLTVVTNDIQIALWLEQNTDVTVIVIGGPVRHHFHCTAGQTALSTISEFHFDKVFLACNGVSLRNGLSTPNIDMANVKTALLRQASRVILLTDYSKIDRDAFAIFAKLQEVDAIITDSNAPAKFVLDAKAQGVKVIQPETITNNS